MRRSGKLSALVSLSIRVIATNSCTTGSSRRRIHYFLKQHRAAVHLRIGRKLLASLTAEELTEQLFEVANQFNRGGTLIVDRDEKDAGGDNQPACRAKGARRRRLMRRRACISRPAWRCWTRGTGAASTS